MSSLAAPFNDWSDRHYSQGFAWRPESACFRTLAEDGEHEVSLTVGDSGLDPSGDVVRAFRVPLVVGDGPIEVASIADSTEVRVDSGVYILQCEFPRLVAGERPRVRLRMALGRTELQILRADDGIDAESPLDGMAEPAT